MQIRKILRQLLPQDTRLLEITCAWALIFAGLSLQNWPAPMLEQSPVEGWRLALLSFGAIKLVSLVGFSGADMVRTPIAFMSGLFWVWVALYYIQSGPVQITHLAALFMGFGNFVAFFVGMLQLGSRWSR